MAKIFSLEDHRLALSDYLPDGRTFEAKNIEGSNVKQLTEGLSGQNKAAQDFICTLENEYIPDITTLFLDEWEQALGIPDDCFAGTGTDDDRRRDILTKLSALGAQTVEDFENVAEILGVEVEIFSGIDGIMVLPFTLGASIFFGDITSARYTIFVNITLPDRFTYIFPIKFGSEVISLLECLFNKMKPANCQVLFSGV